MLLPKVQAGLEAGFYTVEQIAAVTDFVDKNDNGRVCVQIVPQRDGAALPSGRVYYANTTDDHAAGRLSRAVEPPLLSPETTGRLVQSAGGSQGARHRDDLAVVGASSSGRRQLASPTPTALSR